MKYSKAFLDRLREIFPYREIFRWFFPELFRELGNSYCPFHSKRPSHERKSASHALHDKYGKCHSGACEPKTSFDIFDAYREKFPGTSFDDAVQYFEERAREKGYTLPEKDETGAQVAGKGTTVPKPSPKQEYTIAPDDPEPKKKRSRPLSEATHQYPYLDLDGTTQFMVARYENPKDFNQWRPDGKGGWLPGVKGIEMIPFKLPDFINALVVWLCAGEKDALNMIKLGFIATTIPGGEGKWPHLEKNFQISKWFAGKRVYIAYDNDVAGRKGARQAADILYGIAKEVRIVKLPEKYNDVSDLIADPGEEDAANELKWLRDETSTFIPSKPGLTISAADLSQLHFVPPKQRVKGVIPAVGLGVMGGYVKAGKSYMALRWCDAITKGERALGHFETEQAGALALFMEDDFYSARPRIDELNAKHPNLLIGCSWDSSTAGLKQIEKTLEQHPQIKFVVLDTLIKFLPQQGKGKDSYAELYPLLTTVKEFAQDHRISILALHHLSKPAHGRGSRDDDTSAFHRFLGSTAIVGVPDYLIALTGGAKMTDPVTMTVKGRAVPETSHQLRFNAGLWTYEGDPDQLGKHSEQTEIREFLADKKGKTRAQIQALLGKSLEATKSRLRRMRESGEIIIQDDRYFLPNEDANYGDVRR